MAKLSDLFPQQVKGQVTQQTKAVGKKRRPWLEDDIGNRSSIPTSTYPQEKDLKGVYTPHSEKGSMKGVYERGSWTPFKGVYTPHSEKGSMKKVYRPLLIKLDDLRGNPKILMLFLFKIMADKDMFITRKTTLKEIIEETNKSKNSMRTALRFLLKNKLITRVGFHKGRLGWSKYQLKHDICIEIEHAVKKGSITPFSEKGSISSSSININKTTTNIREVDINNANELSENWTEINIEPLADVGFSISHLKQLCKKSLNTPDVVQESIHHFAYSLKHNDKAKAYSHPLNVLMGVLRKGEAWVESRYESPQLIAQRAMLKRKAAEQEEMKKLREAAFNLAFEAWQDSLSDEAQTTLLKETKQGKHDIRPEKIRLIKYFTETIWPDKKSEYLTDQTT